MTQTLPSGQICESLWNKMSHQVITTEAAKLQTMGQTWTTACFINFTETQSTFGYLHIVYDDFSYYNSIQKPYGPESLRYLSFVYKKSLQTQVYLN